MDNYFKGKNVVVTGVMLEPRAVVEAELRRAGANVQDAIRANTDYLICGLKTGATKVRAAEGRGIKMLYRDDYYTLMAGNSPAAAAVVPKMTHAEFVASLPDAYGAW